MRLSVDHSRCCSSGVCVLIAPEVFDQDGEDGRVVLLNPTPPAEHHDLAWEAIRACPCGAISEED